MTVQTNKKKIDHCIAEIERLNTQVSAAITFLADELLAMKQRIYELENPKSTIIT